MITLSDLLYDETVYAAIPFYARVRHRIVEV